MPIYKDKKRNTYNFRIWTLDKYGNRKQYQRSGFKTLKEAREQEMKFRFEFENSSGEDITFQELYKDFLNHKILTSKPQTIRTIKNRYEKHILPYFKDYKIKKIDNRLYNSWKDIIIRLNYSYRYNSHLHTAMVSILNYAIEFYDLDRNIASKVGNFPKKDYIKNFDFWTYKDFTQFINVVDDNVYYTLFTVLYYTGMRLGEVLAITWNDITQDSIIVNKSLAKDKINGEYSITSPKTRKSVRTIKLDLKTIKNLYDLKAYYSGFVEFNNNWFVFGGLYSLPRTTITRKKDYYCELANIKKIRIHDFRHSHATLLLSKGTPITVISKRLGHSSLKMTLDTYSHLIPEDEDKAVMAINLLN